MADRRFFLRSFGRACIAPAAVWSGFAGAVDIVRLEQIDAGPGIPVSTYFAYLIPGPDQPLIGIEFPIATRLVSGPLKASDKVVLETKWVTQPIFLVGTDDASIKWLERHAAALRRMSATGIVMSAPNAEAFRRVQRLASDQALPIAPGPDHWLEEQLIAKGAGVLPVLIGIDGHAVQELSGS